jgi:hypothetical protein
LNEVGADLSPQQVVAFGGDVAQLLASRYEERRLSPPRWVQELLKRLPSTRRVERRAGGSDVA